MIHFVCPGCSAAFTVGDEKAGKKGRCPKCSAQFEIPGIQPAAQTPPAHTVSDDECEIEPCPGCHSKLTVDNGHLGQDVECPYCKTVYTAVKVGSATFALKKEEPPAQVVQKFDEDNVHTDGDDRPRRKRRRFEDDDDNEDDEDDEFEDRPRRQRRRSSRRSRSPSVTAVGIMSLILGGLSSLCSCTLLGVASIVKDVLEKKQGDAPADEVKYYQVVLLVIGVSYVIFSIVSLIAGFGVMKRHRLGRAFTFASSTLAILGCFGSLIIAFGNMMVKNPAGVAVGVFSAFITGGYGVFALFTMIRHGDEFE